MSKHKFPLHIDRRHIGLFCEKDANNAVSSLAKYSFYSLALSSFGKTHCALHTHVLIRISPPIAPTNVQILLHSLQFAASGAIVVDFDRRSVQFYFGGVQLQFVCECLVARSFPRNQKSTELNFL